MRVKTKGPRPEKVAEIELIRNALETSTAAILADFRGVNVKGMQTLRRRLSDKDAVIRVVKNTLLKRAAKGLPAEELVADIEGPTALAYTSGDSSGVSAALFGFAREFKVLTIKGGIAEGMLMDAVQLQQLATLPSRQVLLAQVVGGLQAPVSSFVGTLQRLYGDFVYTLQSVADKK